MSKAPRVVVVGLDGATWNLLRPLAESGRLPTFRELLTRGIHGPLRSCIPPVTFPAWQCIYTGMNPGKLGVYDFARVNVARRRIELNSPAAFHGKPLWASLNECGHKTCMIGIPTAEVAPVDGVFVGGPFAVRKRVYPETYQSVLTELDYQMYPDRLTKLVMESDSAEPPIEMIAQIIKSRFQLARRLGEDVHPAFLALTIFAIDNIQHFFWGSRLLEECWQVIDSELGDLIADLPESWFVIVSDHGFSGMKREFFTSKLLTEMELLLLKPQARRRLLPVVKQENIVKWVRVLGIPKIISSPAIRKWFASLLRRFPSKTGRFGIRAFENLIDWDRSKCVPFSSSIYLNCGTKEKNDLILRVKRDLLQWTEVQDVFSKDDIYSGDYTDLAPDLVILPQEGVRILDHPFAESVVSRRLSRGWSAGHAMDGMVAFYNAHLSRGSESGPVPGLTVYDIAPTILSLFGLPVPREMDGVACVHVREAASL